MIQESLFAYTATVPGVTVLLGAGEDCQLYWQDAPVSVEPPYAIFSISAESQPESFRAIPTITRLTIAVESYAVTPQAARAIDAAIYAAWMGKESSITDSTVQGIIFSSRRESSFGESVNLFSVETEYTFFVLL